MPRIERGPYRSVYCAIQDDPDFQSLSPNSRYVWWALKFSPQGNVAGIFMLFMEALERNTGLNRKRLAEALDELESSRWIARDGPLVWIRNGLRFEPGYSMDQPEKRKGVLNMLRGLPRLPILRRFCTYYGLEPDDSWPEGQSTDPHETPARASSESPPEKDPDPEEGPGEGTRPGDRPGSMRASPEGFEEFWQAYPKERRKGRFEAIAAWKKLNPDAAQVAQILRSLESWKASADWQKRDPETREPKWIPWPQKFLNKRRFEEIVEPRRSFDQLQPLRLG